MTHVEWELFLLSHVEAWEEDVDYDGPDGCKEGDHSGEDEKLRVRLEVSRLHKNGTL